MVRKWLGRWRPGSKQGLQSLSRAPQHPARRITEAQRREALALKRRLPSWGAGRIKRDFDLTLSGKGPVPYLARGGALEKEAAQAPGQEQLAGRQGRLAAVSPDRPGH